MSGRYLTDLADVLRAAGLNVREYSGWQTRARSSGGYSASNRPYGVMWHHTASGSSWNGQKDADYIAKGDSDAPLANLYIDRSGLVWVIAAGATNTNGKGGPLNWSKGQVPLDSMNSYALGVEMGNNGTGEAWPQAQVDAMFRVSNACNVAYGNQVTDVCTHNMWAPTRKIDPATAAAVQGPWKPRSANSSGTWNLDDIRNECVARSTHTPDPTPDPEEEEMSKDLIVQGQAGSLWVMPATCAFRFALDGPSFENMRATGNYVFVQMTDEQLTRIPNNATVDVI